MAGRDHEAFGSFSWEIKNMLSADTRRSVTKRCIISDTESDLIEGEVINKLKK